MPGLLRVPLGLKFSSVPELEKDGRLDGAGSVGGLSPFGPPRNAVATIRGTGACSHRSASISPYSTRSRQLRKSFGARSCVGFQTVDDVSPCEIRLGALESVIVPVLFGRRAAAFATGSTAAIHVWLSDVRISLDEGGWMAFTVSWGGRVDRSSQRERTPWQGFSLGRWIPGSRELRENGRGRRVRFARNIRVGRGKARPLQETRSWSAQARGVVSKQVPRYSVSLPGPKCGEHRVHSKAALLEDDFRITLASQNSKGYSRPRSRDAFRLCSLGHKSWVSREHGSQ